MAVFYKCFLRRQEPPNRFQENVGVDICIIILINHVHTSIKPVSGKGIVYNIHLSEYLFICCDL